MAYSGKFRMFRISIMWIWKTNKVWVRFRPIFIFAPFEGYYSLFELRRLSLVAKEFECKSVLRVLSHLTYHHTCNYFTVPDPHGRENYRDERIWIRFFDSGWMLISRAEQVLGIRDILVRILGSVFMTNGSGCGSGMPKTYGSWSGCGSGTLVKSHKEVKKHKKSLFSVLFLLVHGRIRSPSGAGSRAGSILGTNGSGCESGRLKNLRILMKVCSVYG